MDNDDGGGGRRGFRVEEPTREHIEFNVLTQFVVPFLKSWAGFGVGVVGFSFGIVLLAWLTPAGLILNVAYWFASFVALAGAIAAYVSFSGEVWSKFVASSTIAVIGGTSIFALVNTGAGFWETAPDPPVGWFGLISCFLLSLFFMSGGGVSAYAFLKELIIVFELTGPHKVNWRIFQEEKVLEERKLDLEEQRMLLQFGLGDLSDQHREALLDAVKSEIGTGLTTLKDGLLFPNLRQPTYASQRNMAESEFKLDLVQFLFFCLTIGPSRRDLTVKYREATRRELVLPLTNFPITDASYRKLHAILKSAKVFITQPGMPTELNRGFSPYELLDVINEIRLPKDRIPKLPEQH